MPRHAGSNGIPPHIRALSVIKLGVPVTPEEIDKAAGFGKYASKHILYLKIDGFEFEKEKDGRKVLSYTLVKEPPNAAELRAMQPKVPKSAIAKKERPKVVSKTASKRVATRSKTETLKITTDAPVVTIEVPTSSPRAKRSNVSKKTVKALVEKASARLRRRDRNPASDITRDISTSFSIDSEWDSFEGIDVMSLRNLKDASEMF